MSNSELEECCENGKSRNVAIYEFCRVPAPAQTDAKNKIDSPRMVKILFIIFTMLAALTWLYLTYPYERGGRRGFWLSNPIDGAAVAR
jgi:hypothetical protein